jgi:CheY-like chemotaxis protein
MEALHKAKVHTPDQVLMDLVMQEMYGLEAVSLMRDDIRLATVRVIGASAKVTASVNKDDFIAA